MKNRDEYMTNEELERILESLRAKGQLDSHWYEQ